MASEAPKACSPTDDTAPTRCRRSIFASYWETSTQPLFKSERNIIIDDAGAVYTIAWDDSLDLPNVRSNNPKSGMLRDDDLHSMSSLTLSSLSSDSDNSDFDSSDSSIDTCTSECASSTRTTCKSVHFARYATVVELVHHKRGTQQWYTKSEMEQFRKESVAMSLWYLRQHPKLFKHYRETYLDPVTNTRRRRPMLCLPAFRTTPEEENDRLLQQKARQLRQLLASLSFETVNIE
jgi:hypothetical protein